MVQLTPHTSRSVVGYHVIFMTWIIIFGRTAVPRFHGVCVADTWFDTMSPPLTINHRGEDVTGLFWLFWDHDEGHSSGAEK